MKTIKIKGMSCEHCSSSVLKALNEVGGIDNVKVDLEKGEATFNDNGAASPETIKKAISKIGFKVVD